MELLRESQRRSRMFADFYEKSTSELYATEGSQLGEAEKLLVSLTSHFRSIEKKRLDNLKRKELGRDRDDKALSLALVKDTEAFTIPRGNNRRRSRSRSQGSRDRRPGGQATASALSSPPPKRGRGYDNRRSQQRDYNRDRPRGRSSNNGGQQHREYRRNDSRAPPRRSSPGNQDQRGKGKGKGRGRRPQNSPSPRCPQASQGAAQGSGGRDTATGLSLEAISLIKAISEISKQINK